MSIFDDVLSGLAAQQAFAGRHFIDAAHLSAVAQPEAFAQLLSDFFDTQR